MYRLALLTNYVTPYSGPVYRALAKRVDALRVLVSTPMEPHRPWSAEWQGLDVVLQRTVSARRTWRHPAGFAETTHVHFPYDTVARLAGFRPDVILTGEMGARTLQSVLYGRYLAGRPVIVWATLSERQEEGRGREGLRRWLLERAAAVLVNGESGARYLRRLGVPDERLFKVPYAIEVTRFAGAPLTRDGDAARRLLHIGQLTERKGLRRLFEALERWCEAHPRRTVELLLAGDGPLRQELEARPRPPGLRARFLGNRPYAELPEIYSSCGILVFPTLADEWGVVVNEAMVSGLPVLGSVHAQAVEELVDDRTAGWRFDPEDPASFDRALTAALATPEAELDVMRRAARERALPADPEHAASRIMEAVTRVA